MKKYRHAFLSGSMAGLMLIFLVAAACHAQEKNEKFKGWEVGSAYHQLYDADAVEKLKVYVKDIIEIEPLPGMAKGIGLVVEDKDEDELYTVHICPEAFMSRRALGFKKGDKLTLRGCFVDIKDQEIIMAAKIRNDRTEKVIKVRLTSDGKPFWEMSDEELKKELTESE